MQNYVVKKPVLFVPYPFAAEDHQTANAKTLVNKQAAQMIKDDEALQMLVPTIVAMSKNISSQNELKENIGRLAVTNADAKIAEEILERLTEQRNKIIKRY